MSEETRSVTRRAALGVVAGGVVGIVASPSAASAAAGQAVVQGANNDAGTSETILRSDPSGDHATLAIFNENASSPVNPLPDALRVFASTVGAGSAIQAFGGPGTFSQTPYQGIGVRGVGTVTGIRGETAGASTSTGGVHGVGPAGVGVYGEGLFGVHGFSSGNSDSSIGVAGAHVTAVAGLGSAMRGSRNAGTGVIGESSFRGVHGRDDTGGGTGVYAESFGSDPASTALRVQGPVQFSSSGLATVPAGQKLVAVTPGGTVSATTMVLATVQSTGGTLARVAVKPTTNSFNLILTANASSPVTIAWFVIGFVVA